MVDVRVGVTVDVLEQRLLADEREIARLRARQALALRALDLVQVHTADGMRTLEDWVAARLDVSHRTAGLLTRAARAIPDDDTTARRFTAGDIGLDRAVLTAELASVAPPEVVEGSDRYDLGGLWRLVAAWRRRSPQRDSEVFAGRFLHLQPSLDRGTLRGSFEVPGFEGEIVTAALTARADLFSDLPGPRVAMPARLADALVSISQDSLEGLADSPHHGRAEPVVSIFVDASAAAPSHGAAGAVVATGPRVGPAVLEEILCTGRVGVIVVDDGRPVAATPTSRGIPAATRRFVTHRDGGCVIAGCRSRYRLQPHHLTPYGAGGDHHPDNLATLCWFHHHVVVHRLGHRIDPASPPQRRRFHRTTTDPPDR